MNSIVGTATSTMSSGCLTTDIGYKEDTVTICLQRKGEGVRIEVLRTDAYVFAKRLMEECEPKPSWRIGGVAKQAGFTPDLVPSEF